jgi:dolichol kinase
MNERPNLEQSYGAELVRKTIHLCSLSIPIVYYFTSKSFALSVLIPLLLVFGLSDLARMYHRPTRSLYHRFFGWLLRRHERDDDEKRFNGATYVLLSACLFLWLFPKLVFITAFSILIVSDTLAALVGRKFGAHPFMKKSAEGTLAFFVSALIVVALAPKAEGIAAEFFIGAASALVGAVVEASGIRIDDNLTIPASVGGVLWMLHMLVIPQVNVYALDFIR